MMRFSLQRNQSSSNQRNLDLQAQSALERIKNAHDRIVTTSSSTSDSCRNCPCQSVNRFIVPIRSTSNPHSEIYFITSPKLSNQILSQHEYSPKKEENYRKQKSNACNKYSEGNKCSASMKQYANLQKPNKQSQLLFHSLTNSNGQEWTRQRYCVSRSFGPKYSAQARQMATQAGREKILQIVNDYVQSIKLTHEKEYKFTFLSLNRRKKVQAPVGQGIDARELALEVAVYSICSATFGKSYFFMHQDKISKALKGTFETSLQTKRRKKKDSNATQNFCLHEEVTEAVNVIYECVHSSNCDHNNDCSQSLISNLIAFEHNGKQQSDDNFFLSRDEVISNVHSSLLAGTQTIATTLVGALAHLATRDDLLEEIIKDNNTNCVDANSDNEDSTISVKDVVMETLRILPPVAGLPRIPTSSDLLDSQCSSNNKLCIHKGDQIIIDLLSCAHLQDETTDTLDHSDISYKKSLQFNPKCTTKKRTHAPWGMGSRKCPAGVLSVDCIGSILDALLQSEIKWYLSNDDTQGICDIDGVEKWLKNSVYYQPTLTYQSPILIQFYQSSHET
jgi:cytochrome P450